MYTAVQEYAQGSRRLGVSFFASVKDLQLVWPFGRGRMSISAVTRRICVDLFNIFDVNGDDVLGKEEQERMSKLFHSLTLPKQRWKWEEMDTDGDGYISQSEWLIGMEKFALLVGQKEFISSLKRWAYFENLDKLSARLEIESQRFEEEQGEEDERENRAERG